MAAIIDIAFHGTAFPTGYIGVGTLIGNPLSSANGVSGNFTGAAAIVTIPLGFQPSRIDIVDETNNINWTWVRGLAATKSVKVVAAGTKTIDATTAITVTVDNTGNATVALSAALCASAANLCYQIYS